MSDHYHYEYAEARHDHRGEYASADHDHHYDYAEKHHRHYDDESTARGLREDLGRTEERIRELEDALRGALERIRQLEEQTPEARQAEYEADIALADAADAVGTREAHVRLCCWRAAYDDSIGWWCPEHGDLS